MISVVMNRLVGMGLTEIWSTAPKRLYPSYKAHFFSQPFDYLNKCMYTTLDGHVREPNDFFSNSGDQNNKAHSTCLVLNSHLVMLTSHPHIRSTILAQINAIPSLPLET